MNFVWNDWESGGEKVSPGLCRKIMANAGNSCCHPGGSGLVQFCRNQGWFPSYTSRSGLYQLHSSHYFFLPQEQNSPFFVQWTTPALPLAAPCLGTYPKVLTQCIADSLCWVPGLKPQPAVRLPFYTSPLRWEQFGRRIFPRYCRNSGSAVVWSGTSMLFQPTEMGWGTTTLWVLHLFWHFVLEKIVLLPLASTPYTPYWWSSTVARRAMPDRYLNLHSVWQKKWSQTAEDNNCVHAAYRSVVTRHLSYWCHWAAPTWVYAQTKSACFSFRFVFLFVSGTTSRMGQCNMRGTKPNFFFSPQTSPFSSSLG